MASMGSYAGPEPQEVPALEVTLWSLLFPAPTYLQHPWAVSKVSVQSRGSWSQAGFLTTGCAANRTGSLGRFSTVRDTADWEFFNTTYFSSGKNTSSSKGKPQGEIWQWEQTGKRKKKPKPQLFFSWEGGISAEVPRDRQPRPRTQPPHLRGLRRAVQWPHHLTQPLLGFETNGKTKKTRSKEWITPLDCRGWLRALGSDPAHQRRFGVGWGGCRLWKSPLQHPRYHLHVTRDTCSTCVSCLRGNE